MGNKKFKALPVYETGLYLNNDVKSLKLIGLGQSKKPALLVGNNKKECQLISLEI